MFTENYSPTSDERNWAMLAHLSSLLTLVVGVSTGGLVVVGALLVPLGIYLYFRERSAYVAFHALQATAFQSFAGITFVIGAGLIAGTLAVGWIITGVLSVVLIGLLLIPLALIFTFTSLFGLLAWPVVALGYTLRGGYLAYHGRYFEYPAVGALARRAMQGPMATGPAPA